MGATQVVEPEAGPRRGSAVIAVGIMAAIAVLVAAAVVAWARFGGASSAVSDAQVIDTGPPGALADGSAPGDVPDPVAAAVEAPVVAALRLDALPADLEGCGLDFGLQDTQLESAIVTPDAAVIAVVGASDEFGVREKPIPLPAPMPEPAPAAVAPAPAAVAPVAVAPAPAVVAPVAVAPAAPAPAVVAPAAPRPAPDSGQQVRASCAASWEGAWSFTTANAGPVGEVFSSTGGIGLPDGTLLNLSNLLVPEGAAWLVHDRGGYRLAYPVDGLPTVTVTVPQPESGAFGSGFSSSPAVFLDSDGRVLEETFVGG